MMLNPHRTGKCLTWGGLRCKPYTDSPTDFTGIRDGGKQGTDVCGGGAGGQ